ncbi:izumo sperm-egg fusion protein 1 [Enhydra lutris kenyoni]|uniref:Izumo sperm-egg fusion protein 1 n=1 Tax=Enhydra lutris kenyoni TaxID=391180 RepID=A0A2Y9L336_ENHLU|nr:izumo sperm-egg fusion protein 1 [Enhydra lutris kenyoni]
MGPQLPFLVAALAVCLLPARACLMCATKVVEALDSLEKTYLPDHLPAERHESFMKRVKEAVLDFKNLPIQEDSYMGVVDEPTLENASWSFLKDLKRITDSNVEGELFVKEMFWMLHLQKGIFARFAAQFQKEVFCPNQCGESEFGSWSLSLMVAPVIPSRSPPSLGLDVSPFSTSERFHSPFALRAYWRARHIVFTLFTEPGSIPLPAGLPSTPAPWADLPGIGHLTPPQPLALPSPFSLVPQGEYSVDTAPSGVMLQSLIWCNSCERQVHACRKTANCGERVVLVHEKEDMILNCELNWHRLSQGLTNYSFFRVWGQNSETLLSEGKDPILTKTAVTAEDAGVYRCRLGTVRSIPATILFFRVTVLPERISEELPSSQAGEAAGPGDSGSLQRPPAGQPTSTQCPKSENMLRGRLIGLLIWGFVVLIIGFATAILCFRPERVINCIKDCLGTMKESATPPQISKEKATSSGHK